MGWRRLRWMLRLCYRRSKKLKHIAVSRSYLSILILNFEGIFVLEYFSA